MFKDVKDYPKYEVDQRGEVRRKSTGRVLNWIDNGKGYKMVKLYNEAKPQGRLCLVHRVVMFAWANEPCGGRDVNHIDGDKSNNALSNLEWVTKSQNTRHAHITGLFSSRNKLTIEDVAEIRQLSSDGFTDEELATKYSVRSSIINKIRNRRLYSYV